jgi:hypothetical protein
VQTAGNVGNADNVSNVGTGVINVSDQIVSVQFLPVGKESVNHWPKWLWMNHPTLNNIALVRMVMM